MKYKKIKYDRDVQRLMRERKFPKQLRWLYDYFWSAENDDRAKGEELLAGYASFVDSFDVFVRNLSGDQAAHLESMRDDEGLAMYEIVDRLAASKAREDRSLLNALVTIAAENWWDILYANDTGCGEDQPSWSVLDYRGAGYGWLVHFGDDASAIAYEGFDKGVGFVDKLALTTLHCEDYKDHEGYNFAYTAGDASREGFARGMAKYGKEAVIFQAPYLLFYHGGDQEPQCIFWGPSARSIVLVTDASRAPCIELEDDWGVEYQHEERFVSAIEKTIYRRDDYVLEDEDGDEYEAGDELEEEACFENYDELADWLDDHLYAVEALNKPAALMKRRRRK